MTSKVLFSEKTGRTPVGPDLPGVPFWGLLAGELKRKAWVIALCVLNFIFYGPIVTLITYTSDRQYMSNQSILSHMERSFVCEIQNILSVGPAAVLLALTCFAWLLSKKKTDLYHSIPVSRRKLFAVMYVTGVCIFAATYIFAEIIRAIVAAANGVYTFKAFTYHLSTALMDVIFFFMMYNLAIIAVMLTGNIVVCICGVFVLNFIYPLATECFEWLASIYFTTKSSFGEAGEYIWSRIPYFSPIYTYVRYIQGTRGRSTSLDGFQLMGLNIEIILLSIVMAALLLLAAACLYQKRPSEAAGKALAFKASQPVIRIPLVIITAFLFACGIESVTNTEYSAAIWIALIIGAILMHCVLEIIYNFDFKALFGHPIQLAACICVSVAIVACYWFDIPGYDGYLPERSQIEEAAVFLGGMNNSLGYTMIDNVDEEGYCDLGYVGGYKRMYEKRFSDGPMIDAVYELARAGAANIEDRRNLKAQPAGATNYTTYTYQAAAGPVSGFARLIDEDDADTYVAEQYYVNSSPNESPYVDVSVAWKLKNGRKISRRYSVRADLIRGQIDAVYRMPEYKRAACDIYDADKAGVIRLINVYDNASKIVLVLEKKDDVDAFIAAYLKDLDSADVNTLSEYPIAQLTPFLNVRSDDRVYDGLNGYYIYSGFGNTIAFMESMNADTSEMTTAVDPERVESLVVDSYGFIMRGTPEDPEYDDDISRAIVNVTLKYLSDDAHGKEMIDLISASLHNEINGGNDDAFTDMENRLTFTVYYKVEDGIQRSFTARIRRGDIPQELIDDLLDKAVNGDDESISKPIQPRAYAG